MKWFCVVIAFILFAVLDKIDEKLDERRIRRLEEENDPDWIWWKEEVMARRERK